MQSTSPQRLAVQKEESGDHNMNTPANTTHKRALDSHSPEDASFPDDDKVAKKQRRLVKNREAAAQFRHRQKAYMQKLEKHAEELSQSNIQVTAKIELLDTENKLMKEQLAYLRNFMKQAVALSFPNSLPSLPPDSIIAPPEIPTQPVIPDLFPDDTPLPPPPMDSKVNIKAEPTSVVPDITNFTTPAVPSTSPSTSPVPPAALSNNPFIVPPPITHTHHHLPPSAKGPLITSTNLLADPYLAAAIPNPSSAPLTASNLLNSTPAPLTASTLLNSNTPLTISGLLNAPSPLLGSSMNLASSGSLSSIFNSLLGTDLNFSGVLVKHEPLDPPAQP